MPLDPRHLSHLAAIVKLGSFTEAAEHLGLAQSALSRNIKTLEGQVSVPVLVRGPRQRCANRAGDFFGTAQESGCSRAWSAA